MDLRMPWLSAYCHQKHCIFISSLSAESGGKGIENSKIFNFNRLKIKSTELPNSHDRLNHRSLLDNLETVTHLTKEPHPKEGAKTFPSWTVSLWLGGRGREFEGKEFESSISSGPFLGTNTGWAQTSIPFEGIPYHQRPPFPIPRESCCTFPRRAPSRQSNANTALIRGTRPPKRTFRKLFKPLPLDDASFGAILPRALAVCLPLLPRNTSTLFTEMNAPLWERTRLASSTIPEDRFTVELREIRADYFPISSLWISSFFFVALRSFANFWTIFWTWGLR